jgi:hypothetical protein
MDVRGIVIGAAIAAFAVGGCGGGKEPAPFKEVPQAATTTTGASSGDASPAPPTTGAPSADASLGPTLAATVTKLSPRDGQALGQLVGGLGALTSRADGVTAAAADAQALADRISAGYNPPSGSAPPVARLRDALTAFSDALQRMSTDYALLPQLAVQLQTRSRRIAKRHPADAARLLTAKQRVDAAIANVATLDRTLQVARSKVSDQLSQVSLDGDAFGAAIAASTEGTATALATVNDAVDNGLEALVATA